MKHWQRLPHRTGTVCSNSYRIGNCRKIATALVTLAVMPLVVMPPVSAQNLLVEYSDDKLSIQANNIRVKELLLEIQHKTGIIVNFVADPEETVSLNINEQSVEHTIAKITENHMIIHDIVNGKKTISELIIISDDPELKSAGGGSANLPSGQPAPDIEDNFPTEEIPIEPVNELIPENAPPPTN